jgi:hypothetical protein
VESLEDRSVPALFGLPWQDTNLTLSFAPDGTPTGGPASDLFASLNQTRSEGEWQREILRAYQAWVNVANVNVAVVGDGGQPIGAVGRWQNDDRFGDLRLAGANLGTSVLAIGTAADPGVAGTRAGDVILNTAFRFDGQPYDLHTVMLHEAGHSLGIGNSNNPNSVMFSQFDRVRKGLHASDIAAIRTLYGARPADQFERNGNNNTIARAFHLGGASVGAPETVLLNFADLTTTRDVDVYSFLTPGSTTGEDHNVTVKIQSEGLSLVNARMTVFAWENGQEKEVANATMDPDGFMGSAASVSFDPNDQAGPRRYFVRVEKADGTDFAIGQYALGISFRETDDDGFAAQDLNALIGGPRPVLVNADGNLNNTLARATPLIPTNTSSTLPNSRYEVQASLSTASDVDFYRVTAPTGSGNRVLTATVQTLSGLATPPSVQVLDASGNGVSSIVLASDSGLITVQVTGLTAGASYFIRIGGGSARSADSVGSYRMTADFSTQAISLTTFTSTQLGPTIEVLNSRLYIAEPQVMHFLLSVPSAPTASAGTGVRMIIRDAQGNALVDLFTLAGKTTSGPGVLLRPGEYSVTLEAIRAVGEAVPLGVIVRGTRSTDPIGAIPSDPTFAPTYEHPTLPDEYLYPGNFVSLSPFFWLSLFEFATESQ